LSEFWKDDGTLVGYLDFNRTAEEIEAHAENLRKNGILGGRPRKKTKPSAGLGTKPTRRADCQDSGIQDSGDRRQEESSSSASPPRACTAVLALNVTARASKGRLGEIERVSEAHAKAFNKNLWKIHPQGDPAWHLLGEWLAAGAENFMGTITYDVILAKAIPWIGAAKAWDKAGRPPLEKTVGGRRVLSAAEREEDENRYFTGALDKIRMDQEETDKMNRALEEMRRNKTSTNGATNGQASY
jgi:hypothetical protein